MMKRSIIHLNIADFAVAVERACDCRLRGKAIIIASSTQSRAVVHDMSNEAYRDGIRKGMPIHQAKRYCRPAVILSPNPTLYRQAMMTVFHQTQNYTPLVEQVDTNGHFFLDVTGTRKLFGIATDIGRQLRRDIQKNLSLAPIWTVASNKLVAKVASRLVKPVGEYIVRTGEERIFLHPLSLSLLPGLATQEAQRLRDFNFTTIGQLASFPLEPLTMITPNRAHLLHQSANGIDQTPVIPPDRQPQMVRHHHFFPKSTNDREIIYHTLRHCVAGIARQLRQQRQATGRIGVILHYMDTRRGQGFQTNLLPTNREEQLLPLAKTALSRAQKRRIAVQSLEIVAGRLSRAAEQLRLFPAEEEKRRNHVALATAMDTIRQQMGSNSLHHGHPATV